MRLAKVVFAVLLVLGFSKADLLAQFKVLPKIELNILSENEYKSFPGKIIFAGIGEDNRDKIYRLNTSKSKRKYIIYDVEPGKYLVAFSIKENFEERGVFAQFIMRSYYDGVNGGSGCETTIPNEIEVQQNRNLKLDLVFSCNSLGLGFKMEENKRFSDFDYTRLTFYSEIPDTTFDVNTIQRNDLTDREIKGPFSSVSPQSDDETPTCQSHDICGENGGSCIKNLDYICTLDDGNITVKINNAHYKNEKTKIVNAGEEGVGLEDPPGSKKYTNGITVITLAEPTWCDDCEEYSCEKEKCNYTFDYDVKIEMKILCWDPIEMCNTIKNIKMGNKGTNYNLNHPSPIYNRNCCWFHGSVKVHEGWHCKLWIDASQKLDTEFCEYLEIEAKKGKPLIAKECCEKNECEEQAGDFKLRIYTILFRFLQDEFQRLGAGNYQEPKCYQEQDDYFLKNNARPCNLN
jgi:hypothetical protein